MLSINFNHLSEFIAVSKQKSLSASSAELYMSRSALSEHISFLEECVDAQLIVRGDPIRLTQTGVIFLDYCRRTLASYDEMIAKCRAVDEHHSSLRIAYMTPTPTMVRRIRSCVDSDISLVTPNVNGYIFADLLDGNADVLLTYDLDLLPDDAAEALTLGLSHRRIIGDELALVIKRDHPLAFYERITRNNLAQADIVVCSIVNYARLKSYLSCILGTHLSLRFSCVHVESYEDLLHIDIGDRILFCPAGLAKQYFSDRSDIAIVWKIDGTPIVSTLSLVFCDDARKPAVARFVNRVTERYGIPETQ